MAEEALGFLGGRFDPVHWGHIWLARDALKQFGLSCVYLIPSEQTPLKGSNPGAPVRDRWAMLELAVSEDIPKIQLLDWELEQGGAVYTYDTACYFQERWPKAKHYWILGMDQFAQLDAWYRIEDLAAMVEFICFDRPGYEQVIDPGVPGLKLHRLHGHYLDMSSTALRQGLQSGESMDFCLPPGVSNYIQVHNLYKK